MTFNYNKKVKNVLLVDDDCDSMKTLNLAQLHFKERGIMSKTSTILNTP